MSIKRYLFMLIGGIVVVVAALQLVLIVYFKQHLSEEIVEKSQQLSTQIIEFAVDNVDLQSENIIFISEDIDEQNEGNHSGHDPAKLSSIRHLLSKSTDDNCVVTQSSNSHDKQAEHLTTSVQVKCKDTVEIIKIHSNATDTTVQTKAYSQEDLEKQKIIWKKKLHKIISQKHQDNESMIQMSIIANAPTTLGGSHIQHQFITEHGQQSTAITSLINYMTYLILGSSVLALFLALWLSNHFTRPLQKLSNGFSALEKGEFGIQIKASGINEYRKTIKSFNHMSVRLAQLAESEKTLQQQGHLAELGEVSRGLAHALRNPMHTIGLSVEQLKDPTLTDKLRCKLQGKIQAKIKHIDKTIKALLTLTSAEIKREDDVPLRSVIQDVILEMKSSGQNVPINLSTQQADLTIKGAESEIRAIIHTLVVNAVEANNGQGEITITLRTHNDAIVVAVVDQGNGIAPVIEQRLFQPHVSSKAEGAGMGLYISKRLATLYYGGDITLKNNQPTGCIATVTLVKGSTNE